MRALFLKIGHRIQQLEKMVTTDYGHIWDCCCDHGLLGMLLLNRNTASTVHFIDIVEKLMFELINKLQQYFPLNNTHTPWQVSCADVSQLTIPNQYKNVQHLIIIAGVGGDKTEEFVRSIIQRHPKHQLEFLLCPVNRTYQVRKALIDLGCGLINEKIVQENRRFYEIMHVSTKATNQLTLVGSSMWNLDDPLHQEYLTKTIAHYQRLALNPENQVKEIIQLYAAFAQSEKTD